MKKHLWRRHAVGALLLALAAAVLTVWVLPRFIMSRVIAGIEPQTASGVMLPPMTDHTQRRIVMPSPDLLYALCKFDLSRQPLRVQAQPQAPHYWSIALYAANSDNFWVWNDRQAASQAIDWVILGPKAYAHAPALPPSARTIQAPTNTGVLLMRVLVADYAREREQVEAARRSLRCAPLS